MEILPYASVIMHVHELLSDMFFSRKEKISTRNKSTYGNKTLPKNNSSFTEKSSIYESGKFGLVRNFSENYDLPLT